MAHAAFSMDWFSLRGRNAVVTGGTGGLGRAFALALAQAGANLYIPSLVEDDGGIKAGAAAAGVGLECVQLDLTRPGAPQAVVEGCVRAFGSIDILVNSAAICHIADLTEFGRERWDPMIEVNLTAPFELSHHAAQQMIRQGAGKIINICSLFSFLGGRRSPAYAAAKHGLAGLTKAYSDELAGHNIQVNAIAPGYFATDMTVTTRSDPVTNQRVLDHIPAGRWGEPEDLMGAVVFLAGRAADYVNGHLLVVDGGYLVR